MVHVTAEGRISQGAPPSSPVLPLGPLELLPEANVGVMGTGLYVGMAEIDMGVTGGLAAGVAVAVAGDACIGVPGGENKAGAVSVSSGMPELGRRGDGEAEMEPSGVLWMEVGVMAGEPVVEYGDNIGESE